MNWTTSFLWWPPMYMTAAHDCAESVSAERPPAPLAPSRPGRRLEPSRQSRPRMGQVAGQFVQVYERRGGKDEIQAAFELLDAEAALGKVLVQLRRKTFTVCIGRPRPPAPASLGIAAAVGTGVRRHTGSPAGRRGPRTGSDPDAPCQQFAVIGRISEDQL